MLTVEQFSRTAGKTRGPAAAWDVHQPSLSERTPLEGKINGPLEFCVPRPVCRHRRVEASVLAS